MVDEVFGQKHFTTKDIIKQKKGKNNLKYSEVSYKDKDGGVWSVLEDELLINDPSFQNAAV